MSDTTGDTPDQQQKGNTPPAGTDTPPKEGESQTPSDQNELERERARAATAQKEAEDAKKLARQEKLGRIRAEKALKAATSGDDGTGAGANNQPAGGTTDAEETQVRLEAERGVFSLLAMNPQYNELLSKDETLRTVLYQNPLSVIKEYIDAEDAVDQVKSYLDKRLQTSKGGSASNSETKDSSGNEIKPPASGGKVTVKGNLTPEQVSAMPPSEFAKLPKEQRERYKRGEF